MSESFANLLLLGQIFSCFFMTGVIWIIQLVHYPAFAFVDPKRFLSFHTLHSSQITWIVGPVMLIELSTAVGLCFLKTPLVYANLISVVILWGLTGFVSVPIHTQLAQGLDLGLVQQLVMTNWFRTCMWSLRSVAMLAFIYNLLQTQKGV